MDKFRITFKPHLYGLPDRQEPVEVEAWAYEVGEQWVEFRDDEAEVASFAAGGVESVVRIFRDDSEDRPVE